MSRKTGIWVIGAFGDVATCLIAGIEALKAGLIPPYGLITELSDVKTLDLASLSDFTFAGYDIRKTNLYSTGMDFAKRNGVLKERFLADIRETLIEISHRVKPGYAFSCGSVIRSLSNTDLEMDLLPLAEVVRRIGVDLAEFKQAEGLDQVIVINLASAEKSLPDGSWQDDLQQLTAMIDQNERERIPASVLYAYAAMMAGSPYINFSSSIGSSCQSLDDLSRLKAVPHFGKDGKTGETLVKSVLAPMFYARHLKVLSWESHNILGNRDGAVLESPDNKAAKIADKEKLLPHILKDQGVSSNVNINYVPSLGDWKTAWDFIHFSGFLETKMSLQFTWQGSDSALAAPLIMDLARFTEFALRCGERGAMTHLASFFKAPFGCDEHDFFKQFEMLLTYVQDHAAIVQSAHL